MDLFAKVTGDFMVIAIFGESCTGKTTLANQMNAAAQGKIYNGKDYLRLAKSESEAVRIFRQLLADAVQGENVIYVIAEREHLALLPEGAVRILVTADLDTIKERFAARMHGNLPPPVAAMLEKKHGSFDQESHQFHVHNGCPDAEEICRNLFK